MPAPGDTILLSASLMGTYGKYPTTHSCDVEVRDADGVVVVVKTAMANVIGAVYTYKWATSGSLPEGPYHVIYSATLDGEAAPEIAEVIYIEITVTDLTPILDALAVHDSDIKAILATISDQVEAIYAMTYYNKVETWQYDSQGRTLKVTARYSPTDPMLSPTHIFEYVFTYNADNSVATYTMTRTMP